MSQAIGDQPFPRAILLAAGVLIAFTITVAATARITGTGVTRTVAPEVTQERLLRMTLHPDSSVSVAEAATGTPVAEIAPHQFGFISVVLQGVARERMRAGAAADAPLRLTRHKGGSLRIEDPATGQALLLDAFGHDNAAAFAQLFDKGRAAQ